MEWPHRVTLLRTQSLCDKPIGTKCLNATWGKSVTEHPEDPVLESERYEFDSWCHYLLIVAWGKWLGYSASNVWQSLLLRCLHLVQFPLLSPWLFCFSLGCRQIGSWGPKWLGSVKDKLAYKVTACGGLKTWSQRFWSSFQKRCLPLTWADL
jgi:hypothetical protein